MPDRSLDSLSSPFYPRACEWLARVTGRGVPVMVIQTSRTLAEHRTNLDNRTSGTSLSLHLPRRLRMATLDDYDSLAIDLDKADAMDIAPFLLFQAQGPDKINWDVKDPAWGIIGEEAERVGLRWGGRWKSPFDPGHAEFILPSKRDYLVAERARPWPQFRA